jgi:DNA-binding IclR family transcriptional regulator
VPAVGQASKILLALARHQTGKMTLTEICRTVGIHNSKGYSILNTLQKFSLVQRDPASKAYSLGLGLVFLSQKVLDNLDLRQAALPYLRRLASQTNSTAFLGLISGNYFYVAAKDQGNQRLGINFRLGHRFPLAWGAHGKAIIAFQSEEEKELILGKDRLLLQTGQSECDPDLLEQETIKCQKKGYAMDLDQTQSGIRAVAAPVFGPLSKLIGAFVVVGTFPKEIADQYGQYVAKEGREFSLSMEGYNSGRIA